MQASDSLLLVLAMAVPAIGCGSDAAAAGDERPYRVAAVERGDVEVFVEETGLVEPERQIVVKSPISGVVSRLLVREGARVREGQVLARIIPDIAQANSLARLRSDIAAARIARLYYGASDPKSGGVAHGARVFSHPQAHHAPEIYDGIGASETERLLKAFFGARRA